MTTPLGMDDNDNPTIYLADAYKAKFHSVVGGFAYVNSFKQR